MNKSERQNEILFPNDIDNGLIKKLFETFASVECSVKARTEAFDAVKQIALRNGNFLADYADKNRGKYDRIISELMRYGNFTPKNYPKKVLAGLSKSKDEITRANAIESIGLLRFKLENILIHALDDTFFVSSAAIFSIGEIKLKSAFPKLKELFLKSNDMVVKNTVTEALSKIGGSEVTDFLVSLLSEKSKHSRRTADKIYILKSLYRISMYNYYKKKRQLRCESLFQKISGLNLGISIFSIEEYEEKAVVGAILCYFSHLDYEKSKKIFMFLFDYYLKSENIDEFEYAYIKTILKKVARPEYIVNYIESLKVSSDLNNKCDLLIDVLSDISPKDITNLLYFYRGKRLFFDIKISLLVYARSARLVFSDKNLNYRTYFNDIIIYYLNGRNGNVRKAAVNLSARSTSGTYINILFTFLLKENLPDVIAAFINVISNLLSLKKNKKYFYFFLNHLSSKDGKIIRYSLKVLGESKLSLTDDEIAELYLKFIDLKYSRSVALKRLLAKVLRKYNLTKYKDAMSFLLKERDEDIQFNYLESLFLSGDKDLNLYLDILDSDGFSDKFRYNIVKLIEMSGDPRRFDSLVLLLDKEKSKMVKISILRALNNIDKEKAFRIIKKYNLSRDKDLRDYSLELTR